MPYAWLTQKKNTIGTGNCVISSSGFLPHQWPLFCAHAVLQNCHSYPWICPWIYMVQLLLLGKQEAASVLCAQNRELLLPHSNLTKQQQQKRTIKKISGKKQLKLFHYFNPPKSSALTLTNYMCPETTQHIQKSNKNCLNKIQWMLGCWAALNGVPDTKTICLLFLFPVWMQQCWDSDVNHWMDDSMIPYYIVERFSERLRAELRAPSLNWNVVTAFTFFLFNVLNHFVKGTDLWHK